MRFFEANPYNLAAACLCVFVDWWRVSLWLICFGAFVKPIGVFGEFGILTVELGEAVEGRVYLQDLCREEAVEVTDLVAKSCDRIALDYDALAQNGWLKNDEGDCSAPGFMIWQE